MEYFIKHAWLESNKSEGILLWRAGEVSSQIPAAAVCKLSFPLSNAGCRPHGERREQRLKSLSHYVKERKRNKSLREKLILRLCHRYEPDYSDFQSTGKTFTTNIWCGQTWIQDLDQTGSGVTRVV